MNTKEYKPIETVEFESFIGEFTEFLLSFQLNVIEDVKCEYILQNTKIILKNCKDVYGTSTVLDLGLALQLENIDGIIENLKNLKQAMISQRLKYDAPRIYAGKAKP